MAYTVKYCSTCQNTMNNTQLIFDVNQKPFFAGYIVMLKPEATKDMKCPWCSSQLLETNMTNEDIMDIGTASNYNRSLLDAMVELRNKDVIEYETKMAAFRVTSNQLNNQQKQEREQAKVQKQIEVNVPKCPTCGSTNIQKISGLSKAGSVALWGIFSRKVHKQWHCNGCGSEW